MCIVMEKKMETTVVYRGYIAIMKNKMEVFPPVQCKLSMLHQAFL